MKPTIATPNTLVLGCWVEDHKAAIVGALVCADEYVAPNSVRQCGPMWEALAKALEDAVTIGAEYVLLLTNSDELVMALTRPFKTPTGSERKRVWVEPKTYVTVDLGFDVGHWQTVTMLGSTWAGRFVIQQVTDLPKARALLVETFVPSDNPQLSEAKR